MSRLLAPDLSPRHEARPLLSSPAPKLRKPVIALALSGATLLASLALSGRGGAPGVTGAEVELAAGTPDGYQLEANGGDDELGTVVEAGIAASAEVEAGIAAQAEASVPSVDVQPPDGPEPPTPRPSAGKVTIAQPRLLSARAATIGTVTSSPPRAQATATTATTAKKAPAAAATVAARLPVATTRPPATAAPSTSSSSDAVWDRLAQCESGNTNDPGAPYYGYWQFDEATWLGMGQTGLPNDHSRAQQLVVAKRLHAMRGWAPWPGCARALGLL